MYHYTLYGLGVESNIPLYGYDLNGSVKQIDLKIVWSAVDYLKELSSEPLLTCSVIDGCKEICSDEGITMRIESNANTICIKSTPNLIHKCALLIKVCGISAFLHTKDVIPFHAASVLLDDELVVFAAESGTGKSTLLAKFIEKGAKLYTDDLLPLRLEINQIRANPMGDGNPKISLNVGRQLSSLCHTISYTGISDETYYHLFPSLKERASKEVKSIFILQPTDDVQSGKVLVKDLRSDIIPILGNVHFNWGLDMYDKVKLIKKLQYMSKIVSFKAIKYKREMAIVDALYKTICDHNE